MSMLIAWMVLAVLAVAAAATVVQLIRRPMTELLGANSYIAPAQRFYVRAFAVMLALGALATMASRGLPCPDQRKSMAAMEYVWWVVDGLGPLFWSVALFVIGYVALLTILFVVLGRYRDQ